MMPRNLIAALFPFPRNQVVSPSSPLTRLALLFGVLPLCGCVHLGPKLLDQDSISYSEALGTSQDQQTLLNVVRLRYADAPSFLQTTQIISSYQLQQSLSAGLEAYPSASTSAGNYINGGVGAEFQQSPTFTLQPITGQQFAESFLRPFAPAELLPLVGGGTPVDILFRLDVQSINGLENARALSGDSSQGSPDFFLVLHDLRILQIAGLLDGGVQAPGPNAPKGTQGQAVLVIEDTTDPDLAATENELRHLLGIPRNTHEAPVFFGVGTPPAGSILIRTRSMLDILNQLAIQIEVPPADITNGLTTPAVGNVGIEHNPIVVVHAGSKKPDDPFVLIKYHNSWFWIADGDFNSKVAFSITQTLLSLAQTTTTPSAIITIPAN